MTRTAIRPEWGLGPALVVLGIFLPSLVGIGDLAVCISGLIALYLAYSWNIVGGILGELSLVHMVFWGAGGYAVVLAVNHNQSIALWLAVAVIASGAAAAAVVVTATALRLAGLYLAVFTLIVQQIVTEAIGKVSFLGTDVGLYLTSTHLWTPRTTYYVGFGLVIFVIVVNALVLARPVGLRWLTLRDDPVAAQSTGVGPTRAKAAAYALSAALAVIGGAFQAYYIAYVQPEATLSLTALIAAILAVYVGGPGTVWGPFTGVLVLFGLGQVAVAYSTNMKISLYAQLLQYAVSFLLIRFVTSRLQSGDLLTALVKRAFGLARLAARFPLRAEPKPEVRRQLVSLPEPADAASPPRRSGRPARGTVLAIDDVHKDFGGLHVLRGVSCAFEAGTITALVGPNGAGKTTLCNIVSGFVRPSRGTISLDGADISALRPHVRFRRGIGRTFQAPRLCDRLSLEQNVAVATNGDRGAAREILARVGVDGVDRVASAVNLYERRLAEIARALAGANRVVLLDEPLVGLTHEQQSVILRMARQLADDGMTVLVVEHLIPVIAPAADRMIVLVGGSLIADGTPSDALAQEEVIEAYLGEPIELPA